ncbi:hypothetical protein BH10PSE17_BH10PSE17_14320 [soil metagenome]
MSAYGRVLVCIDDSRAAERALTEAVRLAHVTGAALLPLRVIERSPAVAGPESTAIDIADPGAMSGSAALHPPVIPA